MSGTAQWTTSTDKQQFAKVSVHKEVIELMHTSNLHSEHYCGVIIIYVIVVDVFFLSITSLKEQHVYSAVQLTQSKRK